MAYLSTNSIEQILTSCKGNNSIVYLRYLEKGMDKNLLISNINRINSNALITNLKKLSQEDLNYIYNKEIILLENGDIPLESLNKIKNSDIKILCYLQIRSNDFKFNYIYTLEKKDIRNIIEDNISDVKNFINLFLNKKSDTIKLNENSIRHYLFRNIKTITIDTILNDITYLEQNYILTSRLGIFIYKICSFDIIASEKIIGTYFRNMFGRSQVFNNKKFNIKNLKGYRISDIKNRLEYNIKIDIAKKLIRQNISNIDDLSRILDLKKESLINHENEACQEFIP